MREERTRGRFESSSAAEAPTAVVVAAFFALLFEVGPAFLFRLDTPVPDPAASKFFSFELKIVLDVSDLESSRARARAGAISWDSWRKQSVAGVVSQLSLRIKLGTMHPGECRTCRG